MARSDLLIWVDLKTTGSDPLTCTIVEIATLITDPELEVVAEGPNLPIDGSEMTLEEAEERSLAFVKEHCEEQSSPLCGNAIWKDRRFLERSMPRFNEYLHYRNIDVACVKELVGRWYPDDLTATPNDGERALDDIMASIEELRGYRRRVFKKRDAATVTADG
jgi:oligoribonuclease